MIELTFESRLAAAPEVIWLRVSTMVGVNAELGPWIRMTHPAQSDSLEHLVITPGRPLFQSWLLFLGCIPLDRHALTLERLIPGTGFDEKSVSWMQRVWIHERRLEKLPGGTRVTDRLQFDPRMTWLTPFLRLVVRALFRHRHAQLRRHFGVLPP